jgi:SPP1 gp7 family putative phage head morphogenesis protein
VTRAERNALLRLQAAADAAEPAVRARVLQALEKLRRSITADRLERVLKTRDAVALHQLAALLPTYLRPALTALRHVVQAGLKTGLQQAGGRLTLRFDLVSPHAIQAARDHAAKLVVEVTNETRRAIRDVVARSYVEGIPPRDAARLIRPLVGLTRRQALAVMRRYEEDVKRGVGRAAALARSQRYGERLLRRRALTIARTETIAAASRGQLTAWQQARARGKLSPTARKLWLVTPDDRLCPRCRAMEGRTAAIDAPFVGPFGQALAPPLHPNCRCAVALTFGTDRKVA